MQEKHTFDHINVLRGQNSGEWKNRDREWERERDRGRKWKNDRCKATSNVWGVHVYMCDG